MIVSEQEFFDWERFATIKFWKKSLGKLNDGELKVSTWRACKYWMKKFLKYTQTTPDILIEEALKDNEEGDQRLSKFRKWGIEQGLDPETARLGTQGVLRGFYSHNKINTKGWTIPKKTVKNVAKTDANHPLFKQVKFGETKQLVLDRELIRKYLSHLNHRDQIIFLSLVSTGLDDGHLLSLNVDFVTMQDQKRLFLYENRNKTGVEFKTLFSIEASKAIREYVRRERKNAVGSDPLFVTDLSERKKKFKRIHKREYTNLDIDSLPESTRLSGIGLATNYRRATKKMGIQIQKNKQSPLRPKRLRHVFRSACSYAGIEPDLVRVFLGHEGEQSQTYLGKSREELEFFYEMVEPKITIYEDEQRPGTEEILKLKDHVKKQDEKIARVERENELSRQMTELQKEMKDAATYLGGAEKYDELSEKESKLMNELTKLLKEKH